MPRAARRGDRAVVPPRLTIMPDGHRRAMPQVTAVDELFGTHRRHAVPLVGAAIPTSGSAHSACGGAGESWLTPWQFVGSVRLQRPGLAGLRLVTIGQHERAEAPVLFTSVDVLPDQIHSCDNADYENSSGEAYVRS